jgi:multiple sugar transport system substrate-binding protein
MSKRIASLISVVVLLTVVGALLGACTPSTPAATTEATAQVAATAEPVATAEPGVKQVRWYVGLGAGGNPEEVKKEKAFVEKFNAENPQYQLVLDIVQNAVAYDVLKTQIASGNAPDLVGPVGIRGFWSFEGAWLDVAPFAEKYSYDYSDYNPELLNFYKLGAMGQVGIPFAVYPSALWYNKDLFDEAGVAYPPHKVGDQYEGKTWDFAALRDLAMNLTLDGNTKTPLDDGFDPAKVEQFGYDAMWTDIRGAWTFFGAGSFVGADGKTAVLPDVWKTASKWYFDGMWTDHFIPTSNYVNSDLLAQGNTFGSGNVAMSPIHTWYMCCFQKVNWDVAVIPTYNGNTTAKLHADTFGILKTSKDPDASFQVLALLMSNYAADLVDVYGAFPAKLSLQEARIASLQEQYPNVDFQVFVDMVSYPDNPNHESGMPLFQKSSDRYSTFGALYATDGTIDLDAELTKLITDLQAIFDQLKPIA